jgi:small subunit ribosomal protein S18
MAYNQNKQSDVIEKDADGLSIINNAASVLYMRKNNFSAKSGVCPLEGVDDSYFDYKNTRLLEQFISERGKILPRRITGISSKRQRAIKNAIKRARVVALLPFEKI